MVELVKRGRDYEFRCWVRYPAVYLDHWALRLFSSNENVGARLLSAFADRGTLLFSWANVVEIARCQGRTLDELTVFFDAIGSNWYPLDFNPVRVIERERSAKPAHPACLDQSLIEAYVPHLNGNTLSLRRIVELSTRPSTVRAVVESRADLVTALRNRIEILRGEWRSRQAQGKKMAQKLAFDPNMPASYTYAGLIRLAVREDFGLVDNDIIDLCHSIVASAYGNVLFLDRRWATYVRRLRIPPERMVVFSKRQIDEALDCLDQTRGHTVNIAAHLNF